MATKKTTTTTTAKRTSGKSWLIRACSYFALVIAAFLFLLGGILNNSITNVLNLIGQLVVGIGFPAYDYTRGKHKAWKIVYWVALAVYIFGCIFGVIRGLK